MFRRGRDAQISRFEALASKVRALPAHALIDEYMAALAEVSRV